MQDRMFLLNDELFCEASKEIVNKLALVEQNIQISMENLCFPFTNHNHMDDYSSKCQPNIRHFSLHRIELSFLLINFPYAPIRTCYSWCFHNAQSQAIRKSQIKERTEISVKTLTSCYLEYVDSYRSIYFRTILHAISKHNTLF